MKIRFVINGKQVDIESAADRRAVDVFREDLGLTGTKESCGAGDCGACTVLVNGETKLSCLMLAAQLEGTEVITIEGLSADEALHPVQEAFIEHGAVQCGFCTPGMALAAADLLARDSNPTRSRIREALSGNLCRCTGYQKIVDAVEAASQRMREEQS